MASISKDPGGRRRILFIGTDGKRKALYLGKVPQRIADEIKVKVEAILAALAGGFSLDSETAAWLSRVGRRAARLSWPLRGSWSRAKLARPLSLVPGSKSTSPAQACRGH